MEIRNIMYFSLYHRSCTLMTITLQMNKMNGKSCTVVQMGLEVRFGERFPMEEVVSV